MQCIYIYIQGVTEKNFPVGVLVTEETIQFLRSRCHMKALYFSYFMMIYLGLILFLSVSRKSFFRILQFFTSHFHSFKDFRFF